MSVFSVEGIINLATQEAEKAIKQTGKSAQSAATGIEKRFEKVGETIKKALTVTAFVAAGKALMSLANETAAYGDQVDKMSQKLGMSRKAYQEWSYILSQNGTDVSNLTTAMRTLTTTVANGSTKTKDALKKIGIGFDELNAMSQEDQLMAVVKGLAGMENQSERNALAATLLGRSYQQLLPLLNSGAESIEELRQKAHDLGIVMDDEAIDAAVNYTDNLDSLKRTWKSLKMTMGAQFLKPLTKAFETLTGWVSKLIPSLKQAFSTNDWDGFFNDLSDILAEAMPKVVDKVIGIVNGIISNADKIAKLAGTIISGLINGLSASIPKLIAALPTILSTLWQSLAESIPSALQSILGGIGQSIAGWLGIDEGTQSDISAIFSDVFLGVDTVIGQVVGSFTGIFSSIWAKLNDDSLTTGEKITGVFQAALDGAFDIISGIITAGDNILFDIAKSLGLQDYYETFKGFFDTAFSGVYDIYNSVIQTFGNIFDEIGKLFNGEEDLSTFITNIFGSSENGDGIFGVADKVVQTFTGLFQQIFEHIFGEGSFDGIQSFIDSVFGSSDDKTGIFGVAKMVVETFGNLFEDIKGLFTGEKSVGAFIDDLFGSSAGRTGVFGIAQGIIDTFTNLVGEILSAMGIDEQAGQDIKNAFSGLFSGALQIVESIANTISSIVKSVVILLDDSLTAQEKFQKIGRQILGIQANEQGKETAATKFVQGMGKIAIPFANLIDSAFGGNNQMTSQQLHTTIMSQQNALAQMYTDVLSGNYKSTTAPSDGSIAKGLGQLWGYWTTQTEKGYGAFSTVRTDSNVQQHGGSGRHFGDDTAEFDTEPIVDVDSAQKQLDQSDLHTTVTLDWSLPSWATGTDGSHATGMDYVPFDNYVSRLHRGEAVLSAFEAAEWRSRGQYGASGSNSSYTDNNTLYVGQMYMSNDLDAEQLQQTLATMTRRKNRGYGLT